jgi:Protein O-mannosyl-transferase TMEM260-like
LRLDEPSPRLSRALLGWVLPPGVRGESVLGDLEEEFSARVEEQGAHRARRWYRRQAWRVVGVYALAQRGLLARARHAIARRPPSARGDRPPYGAALLAGVSVFVLYAVTLSRTTAFWDTSEYIATAHILGIPHPPGNPTFVALARAWSVMLSPLGLSVAVRVNLLSAFMSTGAEALWFLVVHQVLSRFSESRAFRLVGAGTAVLVSATAFTVWNQSDVNEKVYTVSLFTIALLCWLTLRWQERTGRGGTSKGGESNLLVLMAFILALSVGNHLMAFLVAPAIVAFVLMVRPRTLLDWRLYVAAGAAGLVGLSIYMLLPLRAALHPVIDEAAPTCRGASSALLAIVT